MALLHTVNKSPFEKNALESCIRLALKGSSILLMEDGVYGAVKGTAKSSLVAGAKGKIAVYVLGPDLDARGVSKDKLIDGVKVVDYGGFVDLVAQHSATQAWL
ncbi:MAG: sulfurtransferase complex subunit TusB [Gammaproteobacteria bacterium]|nr:sulfurtransferase complex subunit TusB [Gammaproteobacteria bacterium]